MNADSSSMPSSSGSAQRSAACVNCRYRKIRCDREKPICGSCIRSNQNEDCEYPDAQGRSRTKILEEKIARLRSRIRELEDLDENTSTITLHNPYQLREGSPMDRGPVLINSGERPGFAASDFAGSSSGNNASLGLDRTQIFSSANVDPWWTLDEPPPHIAQQLMDNFLLNASQFGFFLNVSHFRSACVLPFPLGHPYRPSPALLSTVYLWGFHLSQSDALRDHESTFRSRALQHTSNALSSSHPQMFLHALQAEILLASYFFRNGRLLEGKYHSNAAASLTISGGLYRIRRDPSYTNDIVGGICITLPPPNDAVDEGERINGFWAALILDKCWSVALSSPSNFTDDETLGTRIDTPWPLDDAGYEQGLLLPDVRSSSTVQDFMSDSLDLEEGGFSDVAVRAMAALLFERTTHVAIQWKPDMHQQDAAAFQANFVALDRLVTKFQHYLIHMGQFQGLTPHGTRDLLVTHSLAYAATIQLHRNFASRNANSNRKCLAAVSSVVMILDNIDLSGVVYITPIMGTLWMGVCQVITAEITRLRCHPGNRTPGFPVRDEAQLIVSIQTVMARMAIFAANCPIINYQLNQVQEIYAAI